jgi:hypothetical protein
MKYGVAFGCSIRLMEVRWVIDWFVVWCEFWWVDSRVGLSPGWFVRGFVGLSVGAGWAGDGLVRWLID